MNPVARKHLPGNLQLDAVVVNDQHVNANGQFSGGKHLLFWMGALFGRWHGKENGDAAAFTGDALHFHTALHFRYEPDRDRQSQPESGNVTCAIQPFERSEYPFSFFCVYSHTGIPNNNAEISRPVFRLKTHLPVERELQSVGQQVAGYLPDMRAVTADNGV